MTACQQCHTSWSGHRIEHCKVCHETFTGTSSGDKHRTGEHGVREGERRRRCRTVAEMESVGLVLNKRGQWTLGGTSPWAKDAS